MIIRSTKLDLTTEPFLLVLLKRVLCSRCGLPSDKLSTKHSKNELKLFWGGIFYFIAKFLMNFRLYSKSNLVVPSDCILTSNCQPKRPCCVPEPFPKWLLTPPNSYSPECVDGVYERIKKEGGTNRLYAKMPPIATTVADIPIIRPLLILNYLIVKCYKDTQNFFNFYSFGKTDVGGQKSFNSFLLPLKFIRSSKVAMEHNIYISDTKLSNKSYQHFNYKRK